MIQASTVERTEYILEALNNSNLKAQLVLERYDANEGWVVIDDLDTKKGVSWNKSAKKYKYATISLTPLASDISFSVLNVNGKYSFGSGTDVSGVFDLNTRVRLKSGYIVPVDTTETEEVIFSTGGSTPVVNNNTFYHTQFINGELRADGDNYDRSTAYFTNFYLNDGTLQYNQNPTYVHTGFYIYTKDLEGDNFVNVNNFEVTSNSTQFEIYYRSVSNKASAEAGQTTSNSWTYAGDSINGTQDFDINENKRFFQVAFVPNGIGSWNSLDAITDFRITFETKIEYLYKDIFYLDSPSFTDPPAPTMPVVNCKGRDIYKRALETDINLEDINGEALDDILKSILDRVGIQYTADSIADLSGFGNRTLTDGLGDVIKLEKILERIMQIITQDTGRYQMFLKYDESLDSNVFFVQLKPDNYEANFVFNYKHYRSIGNYQRNYDKMFQRVTLAIEELEVNELVLLDTIMGGGDGDFQFSWTGDAVYLEFRETEGTVSPEIFTTLDQTATTLDFNVTGATATWTLEVWGCKTVTSPFYGEFTDINNSIQRRGSTTKLKNELIISTQEATDITKQIMLDSVDPVQQTNNLNFPYLHLLLEMNDMTMNWARFVFNDDLNFITGFKYQWSIEQDSTVFNLDDSGLNFADISTFTYDDIMDYDIGYVYDMGISTPLSTDAEIDAASIMLYDKEIV